MNNEQTFTIEDMQKAFEAGMDSKDDTQIFYDFRDFMRNDYKIEIEKDVK